MTSATRLCIFAAGLTLFAARVSGQYSAAGVFGSASPSMVMLETVGELYNGEREVVRGTGFVVGAGGKILTNSHVIPDPAIYKSVQSRAYVSTRQAVPDDFSILERDAANDLVLVQLASRRDVPRLPLADSDRVEEGDAVFVMGFPLTYDLSIVEGLISNKTAPRGRWQTQAPLNPGNSGGPVLDAAGRVLGIAVGGVPKATVAGYGDIDVDGISFLIPANVARQGVLAAMATELASLPSLSPTAPSTLRKSYQVAQTKDDHPVFFLPHRRSYREMFAAEPGYRITEASFSQLSANFMDDLRVLVLPGGDQVELTYTLTSGPTIDRYRGWLHGSLQTVQQRD